MTYVDTSFLYPIIPLGPCYFMRKEVLPKVEQLRRGARGERCSLPSILSHRVEYLPLVTADDLPWALF